MKHIVRLISNSVWPSADQARKVHWGGSALLLVLIISSFSSSTVILPSKSQILMLGPWQHRAIIRTETQGIDDAPTIKYRKGLAFVEIPQHGLAILPSRRAEGSIWKESHSAQVAHVDDVIGLQLAVCQVPYLDQLVLAKGDHDGIAAIG